MVKVENQSFFSFLSKEYSDFFIESASTGFQHPIWLDCVYRHLVSSVGAEPNVISVREDGQLICVLPLAKSRRNGLTVVEPAGARVSDYGSLVCQPVHLGSLRGNRNIQVLLRKALGRFDILRISKIRSDGLDPVSLLQPSSKLHLEMNAHSVQLFSPFPQWRLKHMDASWCRELDQKRRKLERKGRVQFECLAEADAIHNAFNESLRFRKQRFEQRGVSDILSDPAFLVFYLDVATKGHECGFARTYILSIDDKIVATLFGIQHDKRFMVLLSSFDSTWKKSSLGHLLFEDVIADCIKKGDKIFDLTIGNETYKQNFGTTATPLYTMVMSGSMLGSPLLLLLKQRWAAVMVRKIVKSTLSPSLRSAIRLRLFGE